MKSGSMPFRISDRESRLVAACCRRSRKDVLWVCRLNKLMVLHTAPLKSVDLAMITPADICSAISVQDLRQTYRRTLP
jgi:hypothetical protein